MMWPSMAPSRKREPRIAFAQQDKATQPVQERQHEHETDDVPGGGEAVHEVQADKRQHHAGQGADDDHLNQEEAE